MAVIIHQSREADMTTGGVYTEYLMESGETSSDLPTDCRAGSLAYDLPTNTLYMFAASGAWGEVGA